MCARAQSFHSCLILCDTMDCSLLGSTLHGILLAGILETVVMATEGIFLTQGSNLHLLHCRQILYQLNQVVSPNTCICKAESLCCTPETNTTWEINYIQIKKKKKNTSICGTVISKNYLENGERFLNAGSNKDPQGIG